MDGTNEELARKINALLSDPEGIERIRSAMSAFGVSDTLSDTTAPPPAPQTAPSAAAADPLPDLGALSALLPLLSSLNKEDENTALLKALRPYLHGDREKKLDESIKMLQMFRFLPLLKDKGLF